MHSPPPGGRSRLPGEGCTTLPGQIDCPGIDEFQAHGQDQRDHQRHQDCRRADPARPKAQQDQRDGLRSPTPSRSTSAAWCRASPRPPPSDGATSTSVRRLGRRSANRMRGRHRRSGGKDPKRVRHLYPYHCKHATCQECNHRPPHVPASSQMSPRDPDRRGARPHPAPGSSRVVESRVNVSTQPEAASTTTNPHGGSSACSNARINPAHQKQMAAPISRPLGFTTFPCRWPPASARRGSPSGEWAIETRRQST